MGVGRIGAVFGGAAASAGRLGLGRGEGKEGKERGAWRWRGVGGWRGIGGPVVIPAESIKQLFEEAAAVDMNEAAHTGNHAFHLAFAVGGEAVGGLVGFALGAFTGNNVAGINGGADEGDAVVNGLVIAFLGMEGEAEVELEVVANDGDVAQELLAVLQGDENIEIVHVAAVMGIAELVDDEAIQLV